MIDQSFFLGAAAVVAIYLAWRVSALASRGVVAVGVLIAIAAVVGVLDVGRVLELIPALS